MWHEVSRSVRQLVRPSIHRTGPPRLIHPVQTKRKPRPSIHRPIHPPIHALGPDVAEREPDRGVVVGLHPVRVAVAPGVHKLVWEWGEVGHGGCTLAKGACMQAYSMHQGPERQATSFTCFSCTLAPFPSTRPARSMPSPSCGLLGDEMPCCEHKLRTARFICLKTQTHNTKERRKARRHAPAFSRLLHRHTHTHDTNEAAASGADTQPHRQTRLGVVDIGAVRGDEVPARVVRLRGHEEVHLSRGGGVVHVSGWGGVGAIDGWMDGWVGAVHGWIAIPTTNRCHYAYIETTATPTSMYPWRGSAGREKGGVVGLAARGR